MLLMVIFGIAGYLAIGLALIVVAHAWYEAKDEKMVEVADPRKVMTYEWDKRYVLDIGNKLLSEAKCLCITLAIMCWPAVLLMYIHVRRELIKKHFN